jgi:S-formylglutathione hydrolase
LTKAVPIRFWLNSYFPYVFEQACAAANQPLTLRFHAGYNHSYYFITTLIEDHIRHHAAALCE